MSQAPKTRNLRKYVVHLYRSVSQSLHEFYPEAGFFVLQEKTATVGVSLESDFHLQVGSVSFARE